MPGSGKSKARRGRWWLVAPWLAVAGCAGIIDEDFTGYSAGCRDAEGSELVPCTARQAPGRAGSGAAGDHALGGNQGSSTGGVSSVLGGAGGAAAASSEGGATSGEGGGPDSGSGGEGGDVTSGPVHGVPRAFVGPVWDKQVIGICWLDQAQESELATRVEQLVRDTWGRVSGLRVVSASSCPAEPGGWITISFNASALATIDGIGADPVARHIEVGLDTPHFDAAIVHLFGHALGFDHPRALGEPDVSSSACESADADAEPSSFWERSIMDRHGYCAGSSALRGWDVSAVQRAYGRKGHGALVSVGNLCLDIPDDLPGANRLLQVFVCNSFRNQIWQATPESQLVVAYIADWAVDVAYGASTPFIQLYARSQPAAPNQRFTFAGELRGLGDACLTRRAPESEGEALSLEPCTGSDRQRFELAPWGALRNAEACLAVDSTSQGSGTSRFVPCDVEPERSFSLTRNAQIAAGASCLEVGDTRGADERRVVPKSCSAKSDAELPAQQFYFRGKVLSEGRCLHLAALVPVLHASLEMADCSDQDQSQVWDYHFNDEPPTPAH